MKKTWRRRGFAEPAAGYYAPVRDTTLRAKSRAGEHLEAGLLETFIPTCGRSPFGKGADRWLCSYHGQTILATVGLPY